MSHECHAHGCKVKVPPSLFMCARDWYSLRVMVRSAIWREYRVGQENDKAPSLRYLAVSHRAIGELAAKNHGAEAAAPYLSAAEDYRAEAIAAGEGDPLVSLGPAPGGGRHG